MLNNNKTGLVCDFKCDLKKMAAAPRLDLILKNTATEH